MINLNNALNRPRKTNPWGRRAAGLQACKYTQSSSLEMSEHNITLNTFIESVSRLEEFMKLMKNLKLNISWPQHLQQASQIE